MAEEVVLNRLFQLFIGRYQEVYETFEEEMKKQDKQENKNDTGTSFITHVLVLEIVMCLCTLRMNRANNYNSDD